MAKDKERAYWQSSFKGSVWHNM